MREQYVTFHIRESGKVPTEEAFAVFATVSVNLRDAMKRAVIDISNTYVHSGSILSEKVCKELWCLRVIHNKNCARLFYTRLPVSRLVFLNGYVKKTDKIPRQELIKALKLMKEAKSVA